METVMEKVRTKPFAKYNPIGKEELKAASAVLKTGLLSDFLGRHDEKFRGGKTLRELEKRWADYHHVKHAVGFNSGTSALIAGLGAMGLLPGDEVLVVAYSMCISATAPLFYDAVPVFVDLEDTYYGMDPAKIEAKITPRTKAILPVDLFGQSSDMRAIMKIAKKHNLKVLCDTSHAPGCEYDGGYAGCFGDIGVFSLNQHKIIHCGEAGIAVTNDDDLALRLQLIRNHAEAVVEEMGYQNLRNMLGGNTRLGELEAAIAIEQLKKLPKLLKQRVALAEHLTEKLRKLDFITAPAVRPEGKHVYYLYPLRFHAERAGIDRSTFIQRVRELGIPLYRLAEGYIKPLYLEPIFARRDELKNGFPWSLIPEAERPSYAKGTCPVVERLYEKEFFVTAYNYPPNTKADMNDIAKAFERAVVG